MGRKSKPYSDKSAPYATMGDSPDDYLYKKGKKQKLVGSADNSPDDGEEELEEAPGDFFNVDGFIYRQHEIEDEEGFYKRWHYMVTPDGEEIYIDYSPYQDMEKEEFVDFVEQFRRSSLKETNMTDELNELRKAAGIPIVENDKHRDGVGETECKYCSSKDCDYDCDESQADGFEESVDEGKLPDALKKHQFGAKDDDDSDDKDSDDKDSDDDKDEIDEEVINWMKRFDRLDGPVNEKVEEEVVDEEEEVDEEVIEEDCPTDPEENADGDCSPFTHADENVAMVREDDVDEGDVDEDFLAPPSDIEDGEYDSDPRFKDDYADQMNDIAGDYDETNIQAHDRDMSDSEPFSDDYPIDEAQYTRKDFRMVADTLLKIEDPLIRKAQAEEYAAKFAASNPLFSEELFMQAAGIDEYFTEEGPGDDEFAHDDDAMVDVGDEEYSDKDDLSDFGGEFYGDSQYYETIEMNDLRRRAGLEQISEDKGMVDLSRWYEYEHGDVMSQIYWLKRQLPPADGSAAYARNWGKVVRNLSKKNPPPEGWSDPVGIPEPEEQTCPVCRGRGVNYAQNDEPCYKCDGEGTIIETAEMNESEPQDTGDYSSFDFPNEQAYYAVADEIGDRIQFGSNDEILVPDALADGILVLLSKSGFEKGKDFSIAGMEEDLQNGYDSRKYADGQDFFPKGSHQSPSDDLGPTASGYGDNAMKNRMRSKETDTVYESMKLAYRRHRKA